MNVSPTFIKYTLHFMQVWPFIAWGILIIAMNAARYSLLASSASSIALLNLINSVMIHHHKCFYFAMVGDGSVLCILVMVSTFA